MSFGWAGEKTRLVPLDKAKHLDNALLWFNDPESTTHLLIGDFPLTKLAEEAYFDRVMKECKEDVPFAIETLEGRHIGFTALHNLQWQHRTATCGIAIGEPNLRGQGYGPDALRTLTRYSFDVLGLRLVMSEVMAENSASQRMMEKAGYREIARIPQRYWRRGDYRDALIFAQYAEEWRRGQAK